MHYRANVPLLASRFLETREAIFDLASAEAVTFRTLPPCPPDDERRWAGSCSRLLRVWHEDLPPLVDYGFTPDGRFEAYARAAANRFSPEASAAVSAFLGGAEAHAQRIHGPVRVGMRLVVPRALATLEEVLDDGGPRHPIAVRCAAEPGAGATTFLRLAASMARGRGYVPVAAAALERWPGLAAHLRGRSVLLLSDARDSARALERWFFRLGTAPPAALVSLRMGDGAPVPCDVTLRLESIEPARLIEAAHVHPPADDRRVRQAAQASGGLPGAFVARLRAPDRRGWAAVQRVAEAHPAYQGDEIPAPAEVEHPWRDLIDEAVRLAHSGRRAAAERDLRQIAAAAHRRQIAGAGTAAEIALAGILLERGRTAEARDAFAAAAQREEVTDGLASRAAIGLGFVHLLHGDLDAAESVFRVSRARLPAEAAVGLAWTLLAQARDYEAERALAQVRDANDGRFAARSSAVRSAIALFRHNLPDAVRAATHALENAGEDRITAAIAATLLSIAHGRIGDGEAVQRHAARALSAARAARMPLLSLAARAAIFEARQTCGTAARGDLDRLLAIAERLPALVRARVLAAGARAHPSDARRRELSQHLDALVRATGARALTAAAGEPPGGAVAADAGALVSIHESSMGPTETLKRVCDWLRERVTARAVLVCDATGAPLARSGAQDAIAAAGRVLQTRVAQPPWASADGLEAAAIARYGNAVQGAIACRWPLSRAVPGEITSVIAAAAATVAPAIASLVERTVVQPPSADGMVGRSGAMERLRAQIARAGAAPFPVLIEGESGAGKELVARAIHRESPRRVRSCVAINCAALSDDLFEAEMFGHARGAFTGAHVERAGLFEQADGGTLFLDEVSELSPRAQAKLLRALQEGEVRRLGESHARRVDVRIIAASNRRLEEEASAGRFRRDLLFRLAVIRIAVPPLRDRREDIPLLSVHCWEMAARRAGARSVLTPAAIARLSAYDWPGNVRELQNVIAALVVQVPRGRVEADQVTALIGPDRPNAESTSDRLEDARRAFERQFIAAAVARCGGRQSAAARQLGISRQGLAKLMRRLDMS